MNIFRLLLTALTLAAIGGMVADNSSFAQGISGLFGGSDSGQPGNAAGDKDAHLFDGISRSGSSSARQSSSTTADLRQARALRRANQRAAWMERNLWMRYEPLRPNWNAVPMMTSRYGPRRIYVPIYVRSR